MICMGFVPFDVLSNIFSFSLTVYVNHRTASQSQKHFTQEVVIRLPLEPETSTSSNKMHLGENYQDFLKWGGGGCF